MEIRDWRKLIKYIALSILALPIILPLFRSGFPVTDDANWFIIRFTAFHQALVSGQFPVRWLGRLNHNYGYPVANFNYPAFMYLAEIPKIFGFSFVNSFKVVLVGSILSMTLFTFLWLKRDFNKWAAFVGSAFYSYNPYLMFDIYKRGSIGEILALAVISFILYAISRRNWVLLGIGYGLLIVSHNTLALIFVPILGIYQLIKLPITNYQLPIASILLGLGLSAFFWIPALYELQYTVFNSIEVSNYSDYFLAKERLYLLGIINTCVFLLSLVFLFFKRNKLRREFVFFVVLSVLGVFLMLPISSLTWKIIPLGKFIQFPFRLLSILVISTSYLSAYLTNIATKYPYVRVFGRNYFRYIFIFMVAFFLYLQANSIFKNITIVNKTDSFYATNEDSTTIKNEYMPKWVKVYPDERPDSKVEITKGRGQIKIAKMKDHKNKFSVNMKESGKIRLNTIYYPGWKAFANNTRAEISYENDNGVMEINLPKGEHIVEFKFSETPLRLISDLISLASIIFVFKILLWKILKSTKAYL